MLASPALATLALASLLASRLASLPDTAQRRVVVCGFDISGSAFALWREARAVCEAELMVARPGDLIVIRQIGAFGYSPNSEIVRVKLPPGSSACGNPFDSRCRAAASASSSALSRRRKAACGVLRQYAAVKAGGTDLLGFVQASSDEFASHPGAARRLVFATDGDETVAQRLRVDLRGGEVTLVVLRTSNRTENAMQARDRWIKRLGEMGAGQVTIRTRAEGPRCRH